MSGLLRMGCAALGVVAAALLLSGAPYAAVGALAAVTLAAALLAVRLKSSAEAAPTQFDLILGDVCVFPVFMAFLALGWMPGWMFFVLFAGEIGGTYARIFAIQIGRGGAPTDDDAPRLLLYALAQASAIGAAIVGGATATVSGAAALVFAVLVSLAYFVAAAHRVA